MKMFQPLIIEATGEEKKINSHFNGKHLSLRSCRLVKFDSKFNVKRDRTQQGRTFYKVKKHPRAKEATL